MVWVASRVYRILRGHRHHETDAEAPGPSGSSAISLQRHRLLLVLTAASLRSFKAERNYLGFCETQARQRTFPASIRPKYSVSGNQSALLSIAELEAGPVQTPCFTSVSQVFQAFSSRVSGGSDEGHEVQKPPGCV